MRTVMLPLLLPALANAALIVFLYAISNFGVPAVLGPRSGVLLLPAEIYYRVTSWPVDLPLATHKLPPVAMPGIAWYKLGFYNASTSEIFVPRIN